MSNDDNSITQAERVSRTLRAALKSIERAYLQAEDDAAAVGYKERNGRYGNRGSSELTATEAAAAQLLHHGDIAATWLNDVGRVARELMHIGWTADSHWPRQLRPGDEHDGVKVGARANSVEICASCNEPVPAVRLASGHSSLIRINGKPYHRNTCYTKLWRERKQSA